MCFQWEFLEPSKSVFPRISTIGVSTYLAPIRGATVKLEQDMCPTTRDCAAIGLAGAINFFKDSPKSY